MDIKFYIPTKVIMGRDCIRANSGLLKGFGSKAMLVTGSKSAKCNGSQDNVIEALKTEGISYVIYDKIKSNPTVSSVYEGAEFARQTNADFIIGIGGGSPMDAAKAIALLAAQDIKEEEIFLGNYENRALPVIMVPTTAGTGSEVTSNAVLTNEKAQTKTSIASPLLFPKVSFLDAAYTRDLPKTITINTALDALSHAVEGMLSVRATEITDMLALDSITRINQCLSDLILWKDTQQSWSLPVTTREKLLYSSMLAGMVIAHTGTTAVHSMGYSLTYFKNIDHGRANALLLPSFLRFIAKNDNDTIQRILSAMEMKTIDEFETIFLTLLGEREQVSAQEIEKFSGIAILARSIKNSRITPAKEDLINIYARSLQP